VEPYLDNNLQKLGFSKPMTVAIIEALKANPYPNPRVGAVLTDEHGQIKAVSNHLKKGSNHAEINLFDTVKPSENDILYITLEPCFHSDTSPSCATEIINLGIKKVIIGGIDDDKRTKGKSVELLKKNNVSVINEGNVNNFINPYYSNFHRYSKKINYLLKVGLSNNGYLFDSSQDSKYITNDISLNISHYLRASADCIIIGKNTLLKDNPKLNVRLDDLKNLQAQPAPIVMWGKSSDNLLKALNTYQNFTFLSDMPSHNNNVQCNTNSLKEVEEYFLEKQFRNIFIEGGKSIIDSFLEKDMIDQIYEFRSSSDVKEGLNIGKKYQEQINSNFKIVEKHNLKDNLLTTYTKN
jgi:diaminohydroxyphosphoribosylaminopyrimidine deaminase/5-amino-6-(5-phosphoribosylamino)uracil reductase